MFSLLPLPEDEGEGAADAFASKSLAGMGGVVEHIGECRSGGHILVQDEDRAGGPSGVMAGA